MKLLITSLITGFGLLVITGCKKSPIQQPPLQTNNIHVDAGNDVVLMLPVNAAYLAGIYTSTSGKNIKTVDWVKISGPSSYILENKNALHTRLRDLVEGSYQFELTVIDEANFVDRDTIVVTVNKPSNLSINGNEIIYHNMQWDAPWNYVIEIKDFNLFQQILPPNSTFKILFKDIMVHYGRK